MNTLVAVSVLMSMLGQTPLPDDPLQRCATKAVRGDFGRVPGWKLDFYQKVLDEGLTVDGKAKRTTYCPYCAGDTCADGSPVRNGICAASPNVRMHAIVWLATDGILKVCDRGGLVKVGTVKWKGKAVTCTRPGESANFDVWVTRCKGSCWHGPGTKRHVPYAVLSD